MDTKYIVVRTYSGFTKDKTLWKVLSRPIQNYQTALDWMETLKSMEPLHAQKNHKFFIVTIVEEDPDEQN